MDQPMTLYTVYTSSTYSSFYMKLIIVKLLLMTLFSGGESFGLYDKVTDNFVGADDSFDLYDKV